MVEAARLAPATVADAPSLAEIHRRAFPQPWSAGEIVQTLRGPGAFALAAGADDGHLGFVLARALAGEAEILTLAVSPVARRRGVGRALVQACAVAAQAAGAQSLWLEVAVDNPEAVALYRRAGFEEAGRRSRYYGRGAGSAVDALVMRLVLNRTPA